MKAEDIRRIIREELQTVINERLEQDSICEGEGCIDEKSVPQPYNRKGARKMTKSQIEKRRKIGRDMLGNEKTVDKFRKAHGEDWKDYLWAAASAAAMRAGQ